VANLVPLNLDKDTGRIVALDGVSSGGSSGSDLPLGCFETCGYIFTQVSPTNTWMVTHNTGLSNGHVQIFDNTNRYILPDEIMFVDANTVLVLFTAPMAGKAFLNLIDNV
jgi:hypothetical protein